MDATQYQQLGVMDVHGVAEQQGGAADQQAAQLQHHQLPASHASQPFSQPQYASSEQQVQQQSLHQMQMERDLAHMQIPPEMAAQLQQQQVAYQQQQAPPLQQLHGYAAQQHSQQYAPQQQQQQPLAAMLQPPLQPQQAQQLLQAQDQLLRQQLVQQHMHNQQIQPAQQQSTPQQQQRQSYASPGGSAGAYLSYQKYQPQPHHLQAAAHLTQQSSGRLSGTPTRRQQSQEQQPQQEQLAVSQPMGDAAQQQLPQQNFGEQEPIAQQPQHAQQAPQQGAVQQQPQAHPREPAASQPQQIQSQPMLTPLLPAEQQQPQQQEPQLQHTTQPTTLALHQSVQLTLPPLAYPAAALPPEGASQEASANFGKKGKLDAKAAMLIPGAVPMKRTRRKKPADAPRRPRSAYMFFLAEFRERFKKEHPEIKKVAEMARAAGEAWRALPPEERAGYEQASTESKAQYAKAIAEYVETHPKEPRRQKREANPSELRRPQSAYFYFLADFRKQYKEEHPDEATPVKIIGKQAGDKWNAMSAEEKVQYERMSQESKERYARLKQLTPAERVMDHSFQTMQDEAARLNYDEGAELPQAEHPIDTAANEGYQPHAAPAQASGNFQAAATEAHHGDVPMHEDPMQRQQTEAVDVEHQHNDAAEVQPQQGNVSVAYEAQQQQQPEQQAQEAGQHIGGHLPISDAAHAAVVAPAASAAAADAD